MVLLSAKARRLVEDAISLMPDPSDRATWDEWARSHEQVKQWDTPPGDAAADMPPAVAAVAASALSKLAESLSTEILSAPADDDEVVQLDNNLAYVRLIERTLTKAFSSHPACPSHV
jgi:hypothetical protein